MLAETSIPPFQPHVEVWLLVASIAALGIYAAKVVQPKAVAAGHAPISRRQVAWFWSALFVLWMATDYPLHDLAEERLYSLHMVQHALLTVVVPPMFLLSIPEWLARLMLGDGWLKRFVYFWARPMRAVGVNLLLVALSHWAWAVNTSIDVAAVHYAMHTVLVASFFFVWTSICGPLPELRSTPPVKIVTLFLVSIIPTIPSGFLVAAEGALYSGYDRAIRLWGLTVVEDQQLAGVVMKVVTGFYLWGIIAVIFFRWATSQRGERVRFRGRLVTADGRIVDEPDPLEVPGQEIDGLAPAGSGAEPVAHGR
jgi:putative membrane protein